MMRAKPSSARTLLLSNHAGRLIDPLFNCAGRLIDLVSDSACPDRF